MATTYDFTAGTTIVGVNPPLVPTPTENSLFILRNIVDFSKQALDVSATDVAQVLDIPAGTTVMAVYLRVITAETASADVGLGYGSSTTAWGTGLGADSTAGSILGATHDWVPIHFTSADTVDILSEGSVDIDGFKCEVVAICLKALDTY